MPATSPPAAPTPSPFNSLALIENYSSDEEDMEEEKAEGVDDNGKMAAQDNAVVMKSSYSQTTVQVCQWFLNFDESF